jgi:hypothetical protein
MSRASSVGQTPTVGDVGAPGVAGFVAVAIAVSALALYGIWAFWPSEAPPGGEPLPRETVHYLGFEPTLSRVGLLFAMVAFAGALGGLPLVLRSLAVSIGNRELGWRAIPGYVVPVPLGVGLASALSLLVHLGLSSGERASPYWFASLAALAGFAADPAGRALRRRVALKSGSS